MHGKILPLRAQRPAGNDGVALRDGFRDRFRREPVAGGGGGRVEQVNRFRHDADERYFADRVHLLEVILEELGRVFELPITVTRRGRLAHLRERILVAHEQNRRGEIGMIFRVGSGNAAGEAGDELLDLRARRRRGRVGHEERMSRANLHVARHAGGVERGLESPPDEVAITLRNARREKRHHRGAAFRRFAGAQIRQLMPDQIRARDAFRFARRWTRYTEKKRDRGPEIGSEKRRLRAFRQRDLAQFGAQFFPGDVDVALRAGVEPDLQSGKTGARFGSDFLDRLELGNFSLERLRDQLFDFRRGRARKNRDHEPGALRDRRVFLLPELGERNRAPDEDRDQRRPGDAAMLDTILRRAAAFDFG